MRWNTTHQSLLPIPFFLFMIRLWTQNFTPFHVRLESASSFSIAFSHSPLVGTRMRMMFDCNWRWIAVISPWFQVLRSEWTRLPAAAGISLLTVGARSWIASCTGALRFISNFCWCSCYIFISRNLLLKTNDTITVQLLFQTFRRQHATPIGCKKQFRYFGFLENPYGKPVDVTVHPDVMIKKLGK